MALPGWPVDPGGDPISPESSNAPATSLFTASSGAQDTDQRSRRAWTNSPRLDSAILKLDRRDGMCEARPTQHDPGGSAFQYTKSLTPQSSEASELLKDQQHLSVNLEAQVNHDRFLDPPQIPYCMPVVRWDLHPDAATSTATVSGTSYHVASESGYDWNEYQARNDRCVDATYPPYDHNNEFPLSCTSSSFCSPASFSFPSNQFLFPTVSGNDASHSSKFWRSRCSPTMMSIGTERVHNHSDDPNDHSDIMRQKNAFQLSHSYPMSGLPSEMGSPPTEDLRGASFNLASDFSHNVSFVDNLTSIPSVISTPPGSQRLSSLDEDLGSPLPTLSPSPPLQSQRADFVSGTRENEDIWMNPRGLPESTSNLPPNAALLSPSPFYPPPFNEGRKVEAKANGLRTPESSDTEASLKTPTCRGDRTSHPEEQNRRFPCDKCSKVFVSQKELTRHHNGPHGVKKHPCPICHKLYSRQDNLTRHIRSLHNGAEQMGRFTSVVDFLQSIQYSPL